MSNSVLNIPENVEIDDIVLMKMDSNLIFQEIDRLKLELNKLRDDFFFFIKELAVIPENQSQKHYFQTVELNFKSVQSSINNYCLQYNKFLPIINHVQLKLGNELEPDNNFTSS